MDTDWLPGSLYDRWANCEFPSNEKPVIVRYRSATGWDAANPWTLDVRPRDGSGVHEHYFATFEEAVAWLIENDPRRSTT